MTTPLAQPTPAEPQPLLPLRKISQLAAEVDARGPRKFLVRGIWPAGDYGVHGAEPKAGKTWNSCDLAVSVASGTPWLSHFQIDTPGCVLMFCGEGGDGNIVRRLRAIATARGLIADSLDIYVCSRAPHLADEAHMAELRKMLTEIKPVLVVLDPLYLAAGGANGADLYSMGRLLEGPQHACQTVGAALIVVTHFNRSRDLKGSARLTGAGPAEWGRVLITAEVVTKHSDPVTHATSVLSDLVVTGGEVPDQSVRIRRMIRAVDPDDLDSKLLYEVVVGGIDAVPVTDGPTLSPAASKILTAVRSLDNPATIREIVDQVALTHGHGLKRPTVSTALTQLKNLGLVDVIDQGNGRERLWLPTQETQENE